MEIFNHETFFEEIGLYPEFKEDAEKYLEYLRISKSKNINQILERTNEFQIIDFPKINGGSFLYKLEKIKVKSFEEYAGLKNF